MPCSFAPGSHQQVINKSPEWGSLKQVRMAFLSLRHAAAYATSDCRYLALLFPSFPTPTHPPQKKKLKICLFEKIQVIQTGKPDGSRDVCQQTEAQWKGAVPLTTNKSFRDWNKTTPENERMSTQKKGPFQKKKTKNENHLPSTILQVFRANFPE